MAPRPQSASIRRSPARRVPVLGGALLGVMVGVVVGVWGGGGAGSEIGFVEDFALAEDREAVLSRLVPGTEEYFYFHALHRLNTERYAEVEPLLAEWVKAHGETPRVWEIRSRRALLTFATDPRGSIAYLERRLGVSYPHERVVPGAEPALPTALDGALVSAESFAARAEAFAPGTLEGYTDAALDRLCAGAVGAAPLDPLRRRQLLSRLSRPDHEGLERLVAADLAFKDSAGFGSLPIHRLLSVVQLEALAALDPALIDHPVFVATMLQKLQPGADEDWRNDAAAKRAYLGRMKALCDRLGPVHHSLKAHVRYHLLALDVAEGRWDKGAFLEYLALPRPLGYVSPRLLAGDVARAFPCNLGMAFEGSLLPPVGNDEGLVRTILSHFLVDAADGREFAGLVEGEYLARLLAETKLVHGLGDRDAHAAVLGPAAYRDVRDRVEIEFLPTNATVFGAGDGVALDLAVKNVPALSVRIFAINARGHLLGHLKEIDTDIPLDGLTPTEEFVIESGDDPLLRRVRHVDLPQLSRPGVYVVDFVGNGRSSRALVRKGRLRALVAGSGVGQRFTILDDAGRKVTKARLVVEGQEFVAGDDGTIVVPASTAPGRKPVVVTGSVPSGDGMVEITSLDFFDHAGESHELVAGIHVDRESLRTRATAEVLVRPTLLVNGRPTSLAALESPKLSIESIDLDGVPAIREVPDFGLFEDRERAFEFLVPQRLASVTFTLSGKVKRLTAGGAPQELSARQSFAVNAIDRTDKIEDLFLVRSDERTFLEVRGKTGEPRPSRPVTLTFTARDFRHPVSTTLKTDRQGAIDLGVLPVSGAGAIETITAQGPEGTSHTWSLQPDRVAFQESIHGRVGEVVRVPFLPRNVSRTGRPAGRPARDEVALFELRGGGYAADRFGHLAVEGGNLVLSDLPAGDYELFVKGSGARIIVRITAGERVDDLFVGRFRQLEAPRLLPTAVERIAAEGTDLVVRLDGANPFTRVHLVATRMAPDFDLFASLAKVRGAEPWLYAQGAATSAYVSGRNLGDEIAYVLRRRGQLPHAGAMVDRPSLLLHPWAIDDTRTEKQDAQAGDDFGRAEPPPASMAAAADPAKPAVPGATESFADLDFLADGGFVLTNLVPGEDGTIRIALEALAAHQEVTVVVVDPTLTLVRSVALPAAAPRLADLRLRTPLDPTRHFIQRQQVTLVEPGKADGRDFELADVAASRFEAYDSLAKVHALYAALTKDPGLAEFAFLLRWPTLDGAEKRRLYSEHACHELNLFLSRKDPDFFRAVVLPGLRTKKDRTFVDHWLLEDDLSRFLEPWAYGQLNTIERVLLADRIAAERPRTERHLADRLALLPPDTERRRALFEAAVAAGALDTADAFGEIAATIEDETVLFDAPQGPMGGAMGGMGGGGMGGGMAGGMGGMGMAGRGTVDELAQAGENAPEGLVEERAGVALDLALGDVAEAADREMDAKDSRFRNELRGRRSGGKGADSLDRAKRKSQSPRKVAQGGDVSLFFHRDALGTRPLYRALAPTKEWAEHNYRHRRIAQQDANLVGPGRFWLEYVRRDRAIPFRSVHFPEASRNFTEMVVALALLDLPFESPAHETAFDGGRMTLDAGGPLIAFHEETVAVEAPEKAGAILVSQNFLRQSERQEIVDGEPRDRFVTGEFLTHVVYTTQVVVTNPTSSRQRISVLLQIPAGSVPVLGGKPTRSVALVLEPYAVRTLETSFAFPAPGEFAHYPVHVSSGDSLVAFVPPVPFTVVERPSRPDERSWAAVSQDGSDEEVLGYLDTHNVESLDLDLIAWRMKDGAMFRSVIERLSARHRFHPVLWSYGLMHGDAGAIRTWLAHQDGFVAELGGRLRGGLLEVDPVARRAFEHLEYAPLVNARQFQLGNRRSIVNDRFHAWYHRFLAELAHARTLSDDDRLAVVGALLAQDRIEEARTWFATVRPEGTATRMQADYAAAVLALHAGDGERARALAAPHVTEGIDRWRRRFELVIAQVDEAAGKAGAAVLDPLDREQRQGELAATSPSLELRVEGDGLRLDHRNLATATVNLYEIDLEVLFSRNPFAGSLAGQFGSIRPNRSFDVALPADSATTRVPLPADLARKNLLVEVTAGAITRSQPFLSAGMAVRVVEPYGQVAVTRVADGAALAKAYVKVYARLDDGSVVFFKDGFTDLRGRFDYASLSTADALRAKRFAILVTSPDDGAAIREADAPAR